MIDIILLEVLLNIWLSNHFLSRNRDSFFSHYIIDLSGFSNGFQFYFLVICFLNLQFNFLLLNNWKYESIFNYFSSRSSDCFYFLFFSDFQISLHRSQIQNLFFLRQEFYFLFLIHYFSLNDWLIINFSCWGFIFLLNYFLIVFRRQNHIR